MIIESMAARAFNAISSPLSSSMLHRAPAIAELGSSQAKHFFSQHGAVNFLSVSSRATSRGRPWDTGAKESISSVVGRAAGAAEAVPKEISSEEFKQMADSYFLTDTRPVILFDGVCNMCNGGVNFMLDNDKEGKVRFAALQSEAGRALLVKSGRASDDISSIVLVDKDRSYIKSEAILRIAQCLQFPYPPAAFLGFILPMFLRDAMYDTVADNRYSVFGKTDACRLSDPRFTERFIE